MNEYLALDERVSKFPGMPNAENVIIIGSGPAGLTAAVYTARALLNPLMFEGFQAGGQLMLTTEVENYPGFPEGVMGPDMMALFKKQAQRFGTRIVSKDVTKVDFKKRPFGIEVGEEKYEARTIIIATGASSKTLGIESERRMMGHGVSTCATCDGAFFRNQKVLVVGGGDTAMEEALFLTRFASKVTVVHRRNQLRASKIMQDKAMKHAKIDWIWDSEVSDVMGDKEVTGAKVRNVKTGSVMEIDCQGIFVAIGHLPNTHLYKGQLEMDEVGYLVTKGGARTNIEGVFACGDVQDRIYRQAITAAGSGCMAAIDCERYLEHHS